MSLLRRSELIRNYNNAQTVLVTESGEKNTLLKIFKRLLNLLASLSTMIFFFLTPMMMQE